MGEQNVRKASGSDDLRSFRADLLTDLRAFEKLWEQGRIESGIRRIGAEQELFLVDHEWKPAPISGQVMDILDDPHFTTELARFNLEFNLDPLIFGKDCLSRMEKQIRDLLEKVHQAAEACGGRVVLMGILPTLHKSDLELHNMTPYPRYYALNEAMMKLRGGAAYEFRIKGLDELHISHHSLMLEACNTSFQVHFQVGPGEFARLYNIAQVAAAPTMAVSVNSPILLARRLWQETRIALFEQSIDTRQSSKHMREQTARVSFGRDWVHESPLEIFRDDVMRFRMLLSAETNEDSVAVVESGGVPQLQALRLHNSTVYRWNRVCYGISGEKPHLRIENRILPSGPTPRDEVANAAFWFGLMAGMVKSYPDVRQNFDFDAVKSNFFSAAQAGLNAQLIWADGKVSPARDLVLETLLPMAREGLLASGVDDQDAHTYLDVIEQRVQSTQTGSQWMLRSLSEMRELGTPAERMCALTAATHARQRNAEPIHRWERAHLGEAGGWKHNYLRVEQYMSVDLVTVDQDEPIELVANIMDWNRIRHVLVEDEENRLVGVVSHRALIRVLAGHYGRERVCQIPVSEVMEKNPITVNPETSTVNAIVLMREKGQGCLPVIKDGELVGLITESDFMGIAGKLMEQKLRE